MTTVFRSRFLACPVSSLLKNNLPKTKKTQLFFLKITQTRINENYVKFYQRKFQPEQSNIYVHSMKQTICQANITLCTISLFPCAHAKCSGVSPPSFLALTRAPRAINISNTTYWPSRHAQ